MPQLFAARMNRLICELKDFDVCLLQDRKGIAREYFEGKSISPRDERTSNRLQLRRLVEASTHVIVFWGGEDLAEVVFASMQSRKKFRIVPVQLTTVKNKDKMEEYDVYIGRGGPWGNPFPIKHGSEEHSREAVIAKFRTYFEEEILTDPAKKSQLLSLRGYRLGCHCKPEACHGDVIAEFLNSYEGEDLEDSGDDAEAGDA